MVNTLNSRLYAQQGVILVPCVHTVKSDQYVPHNMVLKYCRAKGLQSGRSKISHAGLDCSIECFAHISQITIFPVKVPSTKRKK